MTPYQDITPFEATHPGVVLDDELKARGIKQKMAAEELGVATTVLNEIVKGKRSMTAEFAVLLEQYLQIPAEYWMRLQVQYEIDKVRIKDKLVRKTQQMELWKLIQQYVPVAILEKRRYLPVSLEAKISRIWEIFGINSIDELVEHFSLHKASALYKKSEKLAADENSIFAWSNCAQWLAKSDKVDVFQAENKEQLVGELRTVFLKNQNVVEQTRAVLSRYGIKFLVLEKFNQAPIDGYAFWSGENPAIVVTLRKKHLDNFAFTVLHELGHVFLHLQSDKTGYFLDCNDESIGNDHKNTTRNNLQEQEANAFARQSLIAETRWQEFVKQFSRIPYNQREQSMRQFAQSMTVHPSIVLGRYCFETEQYNIKTKIDRTIH